MKSRKEARKKRRGKRRKEGRKERGGKENEIILIVIIKNDFLTRYTMQRKISKK